jgi:predicted glycoside hydrolase/deacetylase ChbG (UPF0249 family)
MLIVNADDFGRNIATTNNIVICFRENCITSTSAMVFMQDSERAACVALEHNLEVGLHLNLDEQFTGTAPTALLRGYLDRVGTFLTRSKFSQVIYNPMLQKQFEYLFNAEYEEFLRLYRRPPSHINGHHHMHLCSNVLLGKIIPDGSRVRRSFTFERGERHIANRLYRRFVDCVVKRRFITTDMFFAVVLSEQLSTLKKHIELAKNHNVELMVHLSSQREFEYLMQQDFIDIIRNVPRGTYRDLPGMPASNDAVREGEFTNR